MGTLGVSAQGCLGRTQRPDPGRNDPDIQGRRPDELRHIESAADHKGTACRHDQEGLPFVGSGHHESRSDTGRTGAYDEEEEKEMNDRPCETCKHRKGERHNEYGTIYICDSWECKYEPKEEEDDEEREDVPSAQQWVPCSEGLPIIETDVLLTSWNGKTQYVGWIDAFGKWHTEDEDVISGYEPLAWMPLPNPWKGEKNEQIH